MITRGFQGRRSQSESKRLPPGQHLTRDFPVLSAGPTPHTPLDDWTFALEAEDGTTDRVVELGGVSCAWSDGSHGGYSLCDALVEVRH